MRRKELGFLRKSCLWVYNVYVRNHLKVYGMLIVSLWNVGSSWPYLVHVDHICVRHPAWSFMILHSNNLLREFWKPRKIVSQYGYILHLWGICFLKEGRYEYKYVVDGKWLCNEHELITKPNADGHVNNYVQVRSSCPVVDRPADTLEQVRWMP